MKCKKWEIWIIRDLDGRLEDARRAGLEGHLDNCPSCRRVRAEYERMLGCLRNGKEETPLPSFWERLQPQLQEEKKILPLVVFQRWCLNALPLFLAAVFLIAGLALMTPASEEPLSHSGILLLEDRNPLSESQTILEAEKPEESNMMLIFASLEDNSPERRP